MSLYTINQSEKDILKIIPFILTYKNQIIGLNLTRYMQEFYIENIAEDNERKPK